MNAWDRQRDGAGNLEPNLWYDRFTDFRLMGADRSLLGCVNAEKVRKGQKKTSYAPGSWRDAALKWDWRERAQAWDEEQRRSRIKEEEGARAKMVERHINLARSLQMVGTKGLSLLSKVPENLTGGEARLLIKEGVAMERLARGLPEYLLAVAAMTDAELLEKYTTLTDRLARAGVDTGGSGYEWDETPAASANQDDTAADPV